MRLDTYYKAYKPKYYIKKKHMKYIKFTSKYNY